MADNVNVTEGSGKTIATDDVGGRQHQLVKPKFGGNDTVTDISTGTGPVDAGTQRLALASDDPVSQTMANIGAGNYETIAASQTDQALGASGAAGDFLASILVIPANTSPGAISIKDGAGSAITVFTGGADSVSTLHPFSIPIGALSALGAWQVTTGADVSCIGIGSFS
ncbi:MAG: hypothetical protein AAFU81_01570 [Pseudomonadota bacterium]